LQFTKYCYKNQPVFEGGRACFHCGSMRTECPWGCVWSRKGEAR
jgi:hypothetical protein